MDMLLFPLLISHCFGCLAKCHNGKVAMLVAFLHACFPQSNYYFLEGWGAKSNFSHRFIPVITFIHIHCWQLNERFSLHMCPPQVKVIFSCLNCLSWEHKNDRKSSYMRIVTSLDDRTLILKSILLKMFPITKIGTNSWIWILAREAYDFSKL